MGACVFLEYEAILYFSLGKVSRAMFWEAIFWIATKYVLNLSPQKKLLLPKKGRTLMKSNEIGLGQLGGELFQQSGTLMASFLPRASSVYTTLA